MTCHMTFSKLSERTTPPGSSTSSVPHAEYAGANIIHLPERLLRRSQTGSASARPFYSRLAGGFSRFTDGVSPFGQGSHGQLSGSRSHPLVARNEGARSSTRPSDHRELAALLFLFVVFGLPLIFFGALYLLFAS